MMDRLRIGLLTHNKYWKKYDTEKLIEYIEASGNEFIKVDPFKDLLPPDEKKNLNVLISRAQVTDAKTLQTYLRFLEYYEKRCPVLNNSYSLITCQDKYRTHVTLKENNLPTPETFLTYNKDKAIEVLPHLGLPVVFKWIWKGGGNGVVRFDTHREAVEHIEELADRRKPIFMQKYLEKIGNRDIRAYVVDGRVFCSIYRVSEEGSWITNLSKGAIPKKANLSCSLEKLAIDATKAVGADMAGVDIAETKWENYIIEVNITPTYRLETEEVVGSNVNKDLVDYACMRADKKNTTCSSDKQKMFLPA